MSKLQELRKAKGLSVKALAELSRVNHRMIEKYENGERDIGNAAVRTVISLADALECDIRELVE